MKSFTVLFNLLIQFCFASVNNFEIIVRKIERDSLRPRTGALDEKIEGDLRD